MDQQSLDLFIIHILSSPNFILMRGVKPGHSSDLQNNVKPTILHTCKNYIIWTLATKYTYSQRFVTSPPPRQTK